MIRPILSRGRLGMGGQGARYRYIRQWLIRDNFTTPLPAGSVNGTAAEPGPGTRTVVDTDTKMSVSGGNLVIAAGTTVFAANIYYSGVSRIAGLAFVNYQSGSTIRVSNGFTTAQTGRANDSYVSFYGGGSVNSPVATVELAVGSPVGKTGRVAVLLRADGAYHFMQGNTWALMFVSNYQNTATVYPCATVDRNTTNIDYIKVARLNWLPAPLTSDGFGTAGALATSDGLGHAEGITGGIGSGGGGKTWTGATWANAAGETRNTPGAGADIVVNSDFSSDTWWTKDAGVTIGSDTANWSSGGAAAIYKNSVALTGKWYLVLFDIAAHTSGAVRYQMQGAIVFGISRSTVGTFSGVGRNTGGGDIAIKSLGAAVLSVDNVSFLPLTLSTLFASTTHSTADVLATVAVTLTAGTQAGVVVNLDSAASPANFVIAYHDGTNCRLEKCVAGTYTTVITAAAAYSAGAELRVIKDSTAYRLYYNNALVGTGTIADAGIVSNTLHGLFSTYASNTLDNFTVYDRGTSGIYDAVLNEVANG